MLHQINGGLLFCLDQCQHLPSLDDTFIYIIWKFDRSLFNNTATTSNPASRHLFSQKVPARLSERNFIYWFLKSAQTHDEPLCVWFRQVFLTCLLDADPVSTGGQERWSLPLTRWLPLMKWNGSFWRQGAAFTDSQGLLSLLSFQYIMIWARSRS